MNWRSRLVYVAAAVPLALGLFGLINPVFTARVLGLEVGALRGLSQVRGTFGAMHIALGTLILLGTLPRPAAPTYLRAAALLVGAVIVGRLLSVVIDGAFTVLNVLFLLSEVAVLAGVLLALLPPGRQAMAEATTR